MSQADTELSHQDRVVVMLRGELTAIGIPPRPAVLASIEAEMRRDTPNFAELERIISFDVGLSASLLKTANSAFFGFSGKVRSIQEALQILGLDAIANAIAALSLIKAFSHVRNMERFWDSSACIAQVSGWLASELELPGQKIRPNEAYTFGLFRDAGIAVLMANFSDYMDVLKIANQEPTRAFTAVEDDDMGVNHAQIGAKLAREWKLPPEYLAAIEAHHDTEVILGQSPDFKPDLSRYFIAIAQLAEYLLQRQSGLAKTNEWAKLGPACLEVLGLTEDNVAELLKALVEDRVHIQHI